MDANGKRFLFNQRYSYKLIENISEQVKMAQLKRK